MKTVGNIYTAGVRNVGSYQVSGTPFITGSAQLGNDDEQIIKFPYVTKSITVIKYGSDNAKIRVHFNSLAEGNIVEGLHFMELDTDEDQVVLDVKCKELFISSPDDSQGAREYRVFASLTGIPTGSMFALTGSGLTD